MIPVFLTIEGIYSYQKKQVIDFARLTEAGLFGIFGTVGSGKSSILEAISYVLYDRIERLTKADKRSYNMMNLRSDRMYIEFDFYNFDNKLFRATKDVRRNSKRFDDIKTPNTVFYENVDQVWKALEHTDAENIIGLSYENFKRTIIIPQGQFKEFLELGAKDRTQMMMEIFDLHRFDLQDKTSEIMSKNRTDKDQLSGKLSAYEEISEETTTTLQKQLIELENELKLNTEIHHKINIEYQQFLQALQEWEQHQTNIALFNQLNELKPAMDKKKEHIVAFENAYNTFFHLFKNESELIIYCNKKRIEKENLQLELDRVIQKLNTSNDSLHALQIPYNQLESDRIKVANFEVILEIKKLNEDREGLLIRLEKGREVISGEEAKKRTLEDMIISTQESLQNLKSQKIDTALLLTVDRWYNDKKNLVDRRTEIAKTLSDIEKKIMDNQESLIRQNIDPKTFIEDFEKQVESIEQQKSHLQSLLMHLQTELKLSEYAEALEDGKPCPLCGSIHHPNIREEKELVQEVESIHLKLSNLNADSILLIQQKNVFDDYIKNNHVWSTQKNEMSEHLKTVQQQEKYLQDSFVWQEFEADNPDKFNQLKNQSVTLENEVNAQEEKLEKYRKQVVIQQENISKYQEGLKGLETSVIKHETSIQEKKSQLKFFQYEEYAEKDYTEIQTLCTRLIEQIKQVEAAYKKLEHEIIALTNQKVSAQTAFTGTEQQLIEWESKLKAIQQDIQSRLSYNSYASLDDVKNILAQPINVKEERKRIEDFVIKYKTIEAKIKESESKLNGIKLDSSQKEEKERAYKASETRLSESTAKVAQQRAEVERQTKLMMEKNEMQSRLDVLLQKEENLKTIFNLMKGSGFVQYISTIYLRQLCDHANVRFHRMTRNQLSLQLNESNDFEVIDYLNEGRSRSVKTLSGGQSFQVSLSLALALAESVQRHGKSNQNFFFIDEGFGTQDIESVNIVFDTLSRLQKENRIVGIISHVEELKDRMPITLQINRDEEHGSIITMEK